MSELLEKLKNIRTFIFDIDGVLTSGNVLVTEEGHMLRTVNIKDGYALQHAVKQGYKIAIISGGNSEGMLHRFRGLGITEIYLGQKNKVHAFEKVLSDFRVSESEVAYMGDDMPDYPILRRAGLPCCPADAPDDIREICTWIAPVAGGLGCARALLEQAMKLQGTWWNADTHNW
ncbi:MAG: HAD-IIIA family hydrolase [Bacteroidia bacterium]|nr:HAD-IIIA family hydrolase [Bacteroidia bacterium]